MIRILAVDDMPQWRNFHKSALNTILKDTDFELVLKNSATEALEVIQESAKTNAYQFDLIISDLQMETAYEPDYAGEWLIKNVKMLPSYINTPIIIVSAAYNINFIAENLGVDCISKPSLIHNPLSYELKLKEASKAIEDCISSSTTPRQTST